MQLACNLATTSLTRCRVLIHPWNCFADQQRRSRRCPHVAALHATSRSTLSSSILSVLKDEQKYAAGSYRKDEELLDDPPNEFEVDSPPGKRVVYLLKEHKDEQLIVELDLEAQVDGFKDDDDDEGEQDDDDSDDLPPVSFQVQVVKQKGVLAFDCVSNGHYITIKELGLQSNRKAGVSDEDDLGEDDEDDVDDDEEEEDDDEEEDAYAGPPFDQLDDTLQQAFLDFLEERGVTADLGRYLQKLLADKQAMEYQAWLQRVRDFIA